MPAKLISISGCFGSANLGDECILSQEIKWIREILPDVKITVLSYDPSHTSWTHGVEAVHMNDYNEISSVLRESDFHIFGGGGIFQEWEGIGNNALLFSGALDYSHFNIPYYATRALMAKAFGVPLFFFAQGVGPIYSSEGAKLVNFTASLADYISVRDQKSKEILEKCGCRRDILVAPDPAFRIEIVGSTAKKEELAAPALRKMKTRESKIVAVVARDWKDSKGVADAFSIGLAKIMSENPSIIPVLTPFHHSLDRHLYTAISENLKEFPAMTEFMDTPSIEELISALANADYVIAMRYHAIILSALRGIPVLPLVYDPKVESLCRQLGIDHLGLGIDGLDGPSLFDGFGRVANETKQTWLRMQALALKAREEALKHKEMLKDFLLSARKSEAAEINFKKAYPAPVQQRKDLIEKIAAQKERIDSLEAELDYYKQSRAWKWVKRAAGVRDKMLPFLRKIKYLRIKLQCYPGARRILRQIGSLKYWIIFSPSIQWDSPVFQRPHQLALAMARRGIGVIFIETSWKSARSKDGLPSAVRPNLLVIERCFKDAVRIASSRYRGTIILEMRWANNFEYLNMFRWDRLWYDYIDELEVFAGYSAQTEKYHAELLRRADVVAASATRLYEKARKVNPETIFCPNAADYDFFSQTKSIEKESNEIIIGYYGALARWFDYELWEYAASRRLDWRFVLVGPEYFDGAFAKSGILKKSANIEYWGAKDYNELPRILAQFDVATIPFQVNRITDSTSPVKLFEYMAGGKPIVTTAMPECMKYKSVLVAHSKEEFVQKLEEALKLRESTEYLALLDREARENTWEKRVDQILEALGILDDIKRGPDR